MQKFRFILVEPEYEANLGAAARLLANFGQKEMHVVNPDCHFGFTANMHAKHAKNLLKNAKIYDNVEQSIKGCSMIVGTTGIKKRNKTTVRHPLPIKNFSQNVVDSKCGGEIAVLFGREGIGLNKDEIDLCDLLISIPTNSKYPVLNLTHAMAIALYELTARDRQIRSCGKKATKNEFGYLKRLITKRIDECPKIKNPKRTEIAIRRLISRALPDEIEIRSFIALLKRKEK